MQLRASQTQTQTNTNTTTLAAPLEETVRYSYFPPRLNDMPRALCGNCFITGTFCFILMFGPFFVHLWKRGTMCSQVPFWISQNAVTKYRFARCLLYRVNKPYKMVSSGGEWQRVLFVTLRIAAGIVSRIDKRNRGLCFQNAFVLGESHTSHICSTLSHFRPLHNFFWY
jgi:hypothetical protein